MYFVLDCQYPEDASGHYLHVNTGIEVEGVLSWTLGQVITVSIHTPINLEAEPVGDFDGPPPELSDGSMLLISDRLVAAMKEIGIDNIQCYPTIIRNIRTGQTYSYQAVNIIGTVAAVDLEKSKWENYDGKPLFDTSFEGFTVREDVPQSLLMFRLAERSGTIMVHESVRDELLARGFNMLEFIDPKQYVAL